MNAVTNILRGLLKMVLGIVKVIWKIIHVMLVFMFSVVCSTTKSYLFTAAPAKRSHCSLPWTRGISSLPPFLTFNVG